MVTSTREREREEMVAAMRERERERARQDFGGNECCRCQERPQEEETRYYITNITSTIYPSCCWHAYTILLVFLQILVLLACPKM